jgi:nucleotide-binding universal stress UspA family protein
MFNRIVAATDMVTTGDAPVISAFRLARLQGARLYLLHVMESASTGNRRLVRHFRDGTELVADADYERTIAQALEATYGADLSDIVHEIRVAAGYPWEEILRWSCEVDSDLIVLGPHSTRAEEKGVVRIAGRVGSTVENVITRETAPVMVVNRSAGRDQLRFQRVLVAVDFSRSCEYAVVFAARLASHFRSRLVVFHMIPVPPAPKYDRADYAADAAYARKRLDSFYETYLDGTNHRFLIRAGAMPYLEILSAAGEQAADLIVMGSHTKEKPGKWYPGSAVERVGYRVACPVVVVTDAAALTHWDRTLIDNGPNGKDRSIHVFTGTGPEKQTRDRNDAR